MSLNFAVPAKPIAEPPPEPLATPLSGFAQAGSYTLDVATSLGRLLTRRVRRTRDVVDAEYDAGHWNRMLASREWERHPDLSSFLAGTSERIQVCKMDGRIVRTRARDYYRYRIGALGDLMTLLSGGAPEIVELGAGYGYNLFSLAAGARFDRYTGFDISENGIEAGRLIADRFGLADRMSFDRLDLTRFDDPNFGRLNGRVAFTYFCIEQIPRAVEAVVAHLLAARPRRVIHVEPTTELLEFGRPRDLLSYLYIKSVDYQSRLFTHLDELQRRGAIRILTRMRMPFAPTIHNDGFVVAWEPLS